MLSQHAFVPPNNTCLSAYYLHQESTCPSFPYTYPVIKMPDNIGGSTLYCEKVATALSAISNNGETISAYKAAADAIPGMKIYLCEGNDTGIGEQFNGAYTGSLRRLALPQSLLQGDSSTLKEVLRHEYFHAACHAWHLALDKDTINDKDKNSQQPFITANQQSKLILWLDKGMRAFNLFTNAYHGTKPEINRIKIQLTQQIEKLKPDYVFWKLPSYAGVDDILLIALNHLAMIIDDDRLKNYKKEDALKEQLAYLFGEIPSPLLEYLFPELCNYVQEMSNAAVIQQREMFILESPLISTNYMCADFRQDLRDYQLTTWLNLKVYKAEELDHFFIFVNYASTHPKKDLIRSKTREALFNLLNKSQVISDPTRTNPMLNEKRHLAYLYSARLAFEDKEYDQACKYYKLAHKNPPGGSINAMHESFNDEVYYAFALNEIKHYKKSKKISKLSQ